MSFKENYNAHAFMLTNLAKINLMRQTINQQSSWLHEHYHKLFERGFITYESMLAVLDEKIFEKFIFSIQALYDKLTQPVDVIAQYNLDKTQQDIQDVEIQFQSFNHIFNQRIDNIKPLIMQMQKNLLRDRILQCLHDIRSHCSRLSDLSKSVAEIDKFRIKRHLKDIEKITQEKKSEVVFTLSLVHQPISTQEFAVHANKILSLLYHEDTQLKECIYRIEHRYPELSIM